MMDIVTLVMACSQFQNYSITNAMIQVASQNNTLMVTPADGEAKLFPDTKQAVAYITQELKQGNNVDIGVTQISSTWAKTYNVAPAALIKPCKNVVIASQIIMEMWEKCGHIVSDPSDANQIQACALSQFKTGDATAGLDYAKQVMQYASANPFEKLAAPSMQHWEKNAKVPQQPATPSVLSNNKSTLNNQNKLLRTNNTASKNA